LGNGDEFRQGIAVDAAGRVHVTGYTTVPWISPQVFQQHPKSDDAFVKYDSAGAVVIQQRVPVETVVIAPLIAV
jgi:hypothetical protein